MRRYVATGAPGAGKITLLGALRERGCAVVREAATDAVTAGQAAGVSEPWTAPSCCEDVLRLQLHRQEQTSTAPVVLFDR